MNYCVIWYKKTLRKLIGRWVFFFIISLFENATCWIWIVHPKRVQYKEIINQEKLEHPAKPTRDRFRHNNTIAPITTSKWHPKCKKDTFINFVHTHTCFPRSFLHSWVTISVVTQISKITINFEIMFCGNLPTAKNF